MNAKQLIKLAPTAVLLGFVAFAYSSLQGALPGAGQKQAELAKGLDLMFQDIAASDPVGALKEVRLRDPFLPVVPVVATPESAGSDAPAQPETDPLTDIVAGLSLDATFVQGRDQLAIINGRSYNKGQRLVLPGDDDHSRPPLVVLFVRPTGVILRGGSKNYVLGYPEQLGRKPDKSPGPAGEQADSAMLDPAGQAAMFQRLLNSPLGAMGKSLIGNPGGSNADARRRKSSRSRSTGP